MGHNKMMKMITKNFGGMGVHLHKRVTLQNMPIWRNKRNNSITSKFAKMPLTCRTLQPSEAGYSRG
jgi:hypothetical protein